jgi:hypothetical protein
MAKVRTAMNGAWAAAAPLAAIPGVARLRYTTSHPRDMDDALIEAHRDLPTLMPYLHLPVQAGSDRILKAMNRKHTGADYLRLVERIRAANPDIALSGDFIVGFPGETDEDFEATMQLVRDVRYAAAFRSNIRRARHARRRYARSGARSGEGRAPAAAAGAARRAAAGFVAGLMGSPSIF